VLDLENERTEKLYEVALTQRITCRIGETEQLVLRSPTERQVAAGREKLSS
jgi:hypothetical protein